MTHNPAERISAVCTRASGDALISRARLLMVVAIGISLLAPGGWRTAKAATVSVTPQYVSNLAKVTLVISGYSSAHETLAPAGKTIVQISGPANGSSASYSAQNVRFEGGKLKVDVNFASGTATTGLLGAGPGVYSVKICQASCTGSVPVEDAGTFNVLADPVSVTTKAATVVALEGSTSVTLTGQFARGATAYSDSPAISVGGASTPDGGHVVVPITTTLATPPGFYNLTVRNTDGSKGTCFGCIRVSSFQVSSLSPSVVFNRAGPQTITVSGANLPVGTQLVGTLTPRPAIAGQGAILSRGVEALSATDWSAAFDLADAAPGPYSLSMASEDGSAVGLCTCTLGVTIQEAPSLKSVNPGSVGQGAKDFALTVRGAGLPHGSVLSAPAASKVTLGETVWVDNQTLTTRATLDAVAAVGKVDVTVTTPSQSGSYTCVQCLVVNPRPTIVRLSPDTLTQGARSKSLTLIGENLSADTRLAMGDGVTIERVKFIDTKQMTLVASVHLRARGGLHTISAQNPDGSTSGAVTALAVRRLVTATIRADRSSLGYGGTVKLSGQITYRDNGAPVVNQIASLSAATTGPMKPLADVTTDKSGVWRYQAAPKETTRYQLDVTALDGAPVTTPVMRIAVAPRLTISSPKPNSSTSASKLSVTGVLVPASRSTVTLSWRNSAGTTRTVKLTTDSAGKFTTQLSLPVGTYRLWVAVAATPRFAAATSSPMTIYRR